jgi:uncharacterized protein YcgL (UPF0745 family)
MTFTRETSSKTITITINHANESLQYVAVSKDGGLRKDFTLVKSDLKKWFGNPEFILNLRNTLIMDLMEEFASRYDYEYTFAN